MLHVLRFVFNPAREKERGNWLDQLLLSLGHRSVYYGLSYTVEIFHDENLKEKFIQKFPKWPMAPQAAWSQDPVRALVLNEHQEPQWDFLGLDVDKHPTSN